MEAMGCCILKLTSKQTKFLSSLTVKDSLNDTVQKVSCEVLSLLGGLGGLKEGLNCLRFANMNKTAEKPTPFGEAENDIADTFDKTVRDAVASFKTKHGASFKMNKLDVDNPCIFVPELSTKKAN